MKKITFAMVSTILIATSFVFADNVDFEVKRNSLPKEEMYQREGEVTKSLAAQARQELEKKTFTTENQEEHVGVGTRAMAHSDFVKHQESRAVKDQEEIDSLEVSDNSSLDLVEKSFSQKDLIPKKIYYTSHEGAYHRPIAVTLFGEQVTLEDGSIWSVSSWDQWKTLDWLMTDTILLIQNKWLFSSYQFMLVNQSTGKEVECNLTLGPIYSGAYTHWIVAIDYLNCEVVLEDGSIWQIDPFDYTVMKKWMINDTVILGINEVSCIYHPNILINVNMLNYSCGICIN
ncbi:MAG: hypothetical protein AAGG81_08400 [Chlamydiota bacterium]